MGIRVATRAVTGLVAVLCCLCLTSARGGENLAEPRAEHQETAHAEHAPVAASHGAHSQAEHGGGINPLTFRTDLAIWTAVVFLLLLLVLRKFAWGPIRDGLDKRERHIADEINAAERTNQEARQLLADYEQKLANSEEEVRRMIDRARRDAERVGQEMLDKARAAAEEEHRRALVEIEAATAGAMKDLADRSATLAVDLAGKIVGSRLDAASHAKLIEQAVADVTRGNGKSGKH